MKFSLTHGTEWELNISKCYSYSYDFFQPNFFGMFAVTVLTKVAYKNFENSNLILRKILNFNMGQLGNFQSSNHPIVFILFQPNCLRISHVTGPTKVTYWNFWISLKKKKTLKFSLSWEPMAVEISKYFSSCSYDSLSNKLTFSGCSVWQSLKEH